MEHRLQGANAHPRIGLQNSWGLSTDQVQGWGRMPLPTPPVSLARVRIVQMGPGDQRRGGHV